MRTTTALPIPLGTCACHACSCPGCADCIPVYGPPTPASELTDPWEDE